MRVVLAPDSFGGTLTAVEAVEALALGWARVAPGDELVGLPLSDGGPGFVDILAAVLPGEVVPTTVSDPLGRPVPAAFLLQADGTAWVESAQACGLHLLAPAERDPEVTTSYGVGELVAAALDADATRVVVGLGGSGTVDGGLGALQALGCDVVGAPADPQALVPRTLHPGLARAELVAATDVTAPLLGPTGAAQVFGPQKGADPAAVRRLEERLHRLADLMDRDLPEPAGVDGARAVRDRPGAGAAGGLGAALFAVGARHVPGIALVLDAVGLDRELATADLVITGEGSYDSTSLRAKVVAGVAAAAQRHGVPCLVVAGQVGVGRREAAAHGVEASYALVDVAGSVAAARSAPAHWLAQTATVVARDWSG